MNTRYTRPNTVRFVRLAGVAMVVGVLAACGQAATTTNPSAPNTPNAAASTDHSGHGGMASGTTTSSLPFDVQFIDGMTPHHDGAVTMARDALAQAEHPQVKQLAQQIIDAQEREVEQMQAWRREWYGDLAPVGDMHTGAMTTGDDTSKPFDQRFLEAMIAHHRSAILMAEEAQTEAEHAELRTLAEQIVADQQREIDQMEQWLREWYGES